MLKISAVICLIYLCCYVNALPHCKIVELPEGIIQRNKVNVIYTMESSCKYCARKATMLPNLKASLKNAGINAHFIVAVSHNSARLSGLSSHLTINKRKLWKAFGEQNNHFYIIDRCGRMVYEVVNPWSSLQMPFLRGAIVATQFSHPCGLCPQDYVVKEENLKMYPPMVEELQTDGEEIPLGIVMRVRHKHHGDPNVYNHIVMTSNGMPGHHRHLPHETNNKVKEQTTQEQTIFSLNTPEGNNQASEAASIANEPVSESSANEKQLKVEPSINSIKNLASSSQRIANETQLSLSSSEIKNSESLLVNVASSDKKDNRLANSAPSDINTEINFTERSNNQGKSQEIDKSAEGTLQELDSSHSGTTEMYDANEEISGDYYDESSEESPSPHEHSQLSSSELVEKQNLKEHYGRILDWIKYDY